MDEVGVRPLGPAARGLVLLRGKTLTATGMVTPFALKKPPLYSQYSRAADTPVFVSQ